MIMSYPTTIIDWKRRILGKTTLVARENDQKAKGTKFPCYVLESKEIPWYHRFPQEALMG